jgi:hypothetical protein
VKRTSGLHIQNASEMDPYGGPLDLKGSTYERPLLLHAILTCGLFFSSSDDEDNRLRQLLNGPDACEA